jgi:hypothetical protein
MHFSPARRAFEAGRGRVYGTLAPWRASKARIALVNDIMLSLKVPKEWPPVPPNLGAMSTMKLDQALTFAGDVGRYLLELLDLHPLIQAPLQAYLRVLQDCQQKKFIIPAETIKLRLFESAAALEVELPAYWNQITKHLATHLHEPMSAWGLFWATNGLLHERLMGKLKRLSRHGNRNRMATLVNNFLLYQKSQDWLLQKELELHYSVRMK